MSRYLASACLFFFSVTGYCLSSPMTESAMQLADTGVVGTDANGDSQTTMMDVNGNLKVVPVDPKAQQKPKQNNNNSSGPQNGPGPGAMNGAVE